MFVQDIETTRNYDECGAVLAVSLIILVLLSLLGIAALNSTDTEMMISANERDHKDAFYYADGGVNVGSEILEESIDAGFASNSSGVQIYDDVFFMRDRSSWEGIAFSSVNSSFGIYLDGISGTYVRIGCNPPKDLPGFNNQMPAPYGLPQAVRGQYFLVRSHRYGLRNSAAEIDVEWRHLIY